MDKSFDELYEVMKLNREKCHWAKKQDIKSYVTYLQNELDELKEAIDRNDFKDIKDELGDVCFNTTFMLVLFEEKEKGSAKEVIDNAIKKLKRRKPWIFNDDEIPSSEEAKRIWNNAKEEERNMNFYGP